MKIYLLRHGETVYNAQGRYQGRLDPPLSEHGRSRLRRADLSPEKVYVSPMLRARQTAAHLFPEARQIVIPDFREMDFGRFEGRHWREMAEDPGYRAWVDSGCEAPCPGGESKADFSRRVRAAFVPLLDGALDRKEDSLVIMAHGGTQMAIMAEYALPHRGYFDWISPLGGGFLLEADRWPAEKKLYHLETVDFAAGGEEL